MREVVEEKGWFRELEEKIEQLMSEKQEIERKVELERQEMELEKQEMIHRMIEDGVPPEKVEKWVGCKSI